MLNNLIPFNEMPATHNLVVLARGPEKTGKSELGYTMPGDIFNICMDKPPCRATLQRHAKNRRIDTKLYIPVREPGMTEDELIEENRALLTEFRSDLPDAISTYDSLLFDSATNLWKLVRLANFGRESGVQPRDYYSPNLIMEKIVGRLHNESKNALFTTRVKDEYKESKRGGYAQSAPTGNKLIDTWRGLPFEVHCNVSMSRDADEPYTFRCTILDSSIDGSLKGIEIVDADINWDTIADMHYE